MLSTVAENRLRLTLHTLVRCLTFSCFRNVLLAKRSRPFYACYHDALMDFNNVTLLLLRHPADTMSDLCISGRDINVYHIGIVLLK